MVLPEPRQPKAYTTRKTVYRLAREMIKQSFEGQSFPSLTNIGVVFGLSTICIIITDVTVFTSFNKHNRYSLAVMKGAPLTSFASFSSTSFSSANVHILSVRGSLYVVSIRPLDKNSFPG